MIGESKADIEESFSIRTADHVRSLLKEVGHDKVFGRTEVQEILNLKHTRSTELLKEMAETGVIEPVTGFGKGKYRFIMHED